MTCRRLLRNIPSIRDALYAVRMSSDTNISPADHALTEWLLTDGHGGFAMGTVGGFNTRRYHGLLIAAAQPPVKRIAAVHSTVDRVQLADGTTQQLNQHLFANHNNDVIAAPRQDAALSPANFHISPGRSVQWQWQLDGFTIIKTLEVANTPATMHLRWQLQSANPDTCRLIISPLVLLRDFHSLCQQHTDADTYHTTLDETSLRITRDDHQLTINASAGTWQTDNTWWQNFAYPIDRDRGQSWQEDALIPATLHATLTNNMPLEWTMQLHSKNNATLHKSPSATTIKPQTHHTNFPTLEAAADAFIVHRSTETDTAKTPGRSIIAGYPWFADWGRDAMISLPGLLLTTNRLDEACQVLHTFANNIRRGLIPNRFDDHGNDAHYNTIDASLWFIHAVHEYHVAIGWQENDSTKVDTALLNACRSIIRAYRNGTDYKIGISRDGLITAGDETTQLTWMDAKRDGIVFTPRHGKAVEINAFWHHALQCVAAMSDDEDEAGELRELAGYVSLSFQMNFWWTEKNCLYDVLVPQELGEEVEQNTGDRIQESAMEDSLKFPTTVNHEPYRPDFRLRPNQIFAASLSYSPLTDDQKKCVVNVVEREFLTPFGLRTLDRNDPEYCPRYEGNLHDRDRAYHNGTVWPWLIGHFCEAYLRVHEFSNDSKQRVREILQPLKNGTGTVFATPNPIRHLPFTIYPSSPNPPNTCLGHIAEIYDGDPPHHPNGCPAQAWSVAEVLRLSVLAE